jgi:hypothetical protein
MIIAPILTLPNFSLPFTLETNAYGCGIVAVLMQQGQPITFFSQVLGPRTSDQSTYHKETSNSAITEKMETLFLRRTVDNQK